MSTRALAARRITARTIAVLGMAWVFANCLAELQRPWKPIGVWPIRADYDGVVSRSTDYDLPAVPPKVPRDCFGKTLPKGNLDLSATDRAPRVRVVTASARPGMKAMVRYESSSSDVCIKAHAERPSQARHVTDALRSLGAMAMIALAAMLLWRSTAGHPHAARGWGFAGKNRDPASGVGFYLFALGFAPLSESVLNAWYLRPESLVIVQNLLNDVTECAGLVGLMIFFEGLTEVRKTLRTAVAVIAVAAMCAGVFADLTLLFSGRHSNIWFVGSQMLVAVGAAFALAALLETFDASEGIIRARMRWICWSFGLGIPLYLAGYLVDNVPSLDFIGVPGFVVNLLYLGIILAPVSIAYVEVRHHVMDLGLFVSQRAVAAVLVAAIIYVVWVALTTLPAIPSVPEVPFAAMLSVLLAILFDPARRLGERAVDALIGKKRTQRVRMLRKRSRELAQTPASDDLDNAIVAAPQQALALTCAALVAGDSVVATNAYHDPQHEKALVRLASNPRLLAALDAGARGVRLHEFRYHLLADFHNEIQPLAALVVEDPGKPSRVLIVGPHDDGTDIDDEELIALGDFATHAATARLARRFP